MTLARGGRAPDLDGQLCAIIRAEPPTSNVATGSFSPPDVASAGEHIVEVVTAKALAVGLRLPVRLLRRTYVCIRVLTFSKGVCVKMISQHPLPNANSTHHSQGGANGRCSGSNLGLVIFQEFVSSLLVREPGAAVRHVERFRGW